MGVRMKIEPLTKDKINYHRVNTHEIRSACEWYLRYKDDNELLEAESPKYFSELVSDASNKKIPDYNVWLFRKAFEGVLE